MTKDKTREEEMNDKTHYHRDRVISGHAPHKLVKMEIKQYIDKKDRQKAIQVFIKAQPDGVDGGWWDFDVRYLRRHGNTQDDILNSGCGYVQHTSLYQLYLKATLEAMLYINSLDRRLKPDTGEVTIHMPCKDCIKWLQENETKMLTPKDRAKAKRGYRQFVSAIRIETKQWKVEYNLSKEK